MPITLDGSAGVTTPNISSTTSTLGALTQALDLGSTGQIVFPATQNASANANTLDDYEEGTWTPTYLGSSTNPTGVTYANANAATYVKIGRCVVVNFRINVTTFTAGTGDFRIGGLPFTAAASPNEFIGNCFFRYLDWDSTTYKGVCSYIPGNQNYIELLQYGDNSDVARVPVTGWTSDGTSKYISGTLVYTV